MLMQGITCFIFPSALSGKNSALPMSQEVFGVQMHGRAAIQISCDLGQ